MQHNTQFIRYIDTKHAIAAAKKRWSSSYEGFNKILAGAHLFPAGHYSRIKCYAEVIFPIPIDLHTGKSDTMDWVVYNKIERDIDGKVYFLWQYTPNRSLMRDQLSDLLLLLEQLQMPVELMLLENAIEFAGIDL